MKLPPSKAEIRRQLNQQTQAFLQQGGQVRQVPRGASGRDSVDGPLRQNSFVANDGPKTDPENQQPLTDVIKTIEARRKAKPSKAKPAKPHPPRPKRKLIYDDFGEPLRWEWVEE